MFSTKLKKQFLVLSFGKGLKLACKSHMSLFSVKVGLNILPKGKSLRWSNLEAFADDKVNVIKNLKIAFDKARKHCRKRRKCWLPAFSPFPTMFSKCFFFKVVKSEHCVVKI